MFGVTVKMDSTPKRVEDAKKKGAYRTMRHAAFSVAKSARDSMVFAKGPSKPGLPPHRHTGRLARAITAADGGTDQWVAGASYSRVKVGGRPEWLARVHEHGGTFQRKKKRKRTAGRDARGRFIKSSESAELLQTVTYPARPFMLPALQRNLARFHRDWQGAIS